MNTSTLLWFGLSPARVVSLVLIVLIAGTALVVGVRSAPTGAPATYVGQATCLQSGCHDSRSTSGIYPGPSEYLKTFHQRSHRIPDSTSVRIHRYFTGDSIVALPVEVNGVRDTLRIRFGSIGDPHRYRLGFSLAGGDSLPLMDIAYTIGGNAHIQRYMVEHEGSRYVLPFQYVLPSYGDGSDTGTTIVPVEAGKWMTVDSSTNPPRLRFLRWNTNGFRRQSWDRNCAPCHATVSDIGFGVKGTDSSWHSSVVRSNDMGEMSVDCESCHGPGSDHVLKPTSANIVSPKGFGTSSTGTDLKLALCNQCHTRAKSTSGHYDFPYDEEQSQQYVPGTPLESFVSGGDVQDGAERWPDSSELGHHQTGQDFLLAYGYRKHVYKNGCWTCHSVHANGNGLPFQLNQNWYSLHDGEGCVSCHGSMGALFERPLEDLTRTEVVNGRRINVHTRHDPQISQCVNCHFSKTASISFTDLPTKPYYEFTSHHFRVIRPLLTREFGNDPNGIGQINTCAEACHRNGRGSRNFRESDPVAPDFGIADRVLTRWNEETDIELADSLWQHYQEMFLPSLGADREAGPATAASGLDLPFPNPARDHCSIRFTVAAAARVSLEVSALDGRRVRLLAAGRHQAGAYVVRWETDDERGIAVPSGSYVVRLAIDGAVVSKKIQVER